MNRTLQRRGTAGATLAAIAGVWLTMFLLGDGPVDRAVLMALYAGDEAELVTVALALTLLGNWYVLLIVTVIGALWLLLRRRASAALMLVLVSLSGRGLVVLQKAELARLRPDEALRKVEVSSMAFPSGHAANSMVVYLTLALLLWTDPRQRRLAAAAALLLSLAVGLSRPMLGVHWPSDVIGGWSFGLFWVVFCFWLAGRAGANGFTGRSTR